MPEAAGGASNWYWDRYWRYDRLASCFDPDSNGYDVHVRSHWREIFERAGDGISILDLCTGNGALPVIAREEAIRLGKGFRITAVDLADIDPRHFVSGHEESLRDIAFMGGIPVEALPFPAESFDLVTSQYGLEYTDTDKSVPEAIRVLKVGGHCEFIMHAAEGGVAASAREAVEGVHFLTGELALPEKTRRAIRSTCAHETGADTSPQAVAQAETARAEFKAALAAVRDALERRGNEDYMRHAGGLAVNAFEARRYHPLETVLANVDLMETELRAHAERNRALADAALSRTAAEALTRKLAGAGTVGVELAEFNHPDTGFCAWHVSAQRA